MLNEKLTENIREHGIFKESGEGRRKILADDIGFRMDEKAEYVLIGGCHQPEDHPHVFAAIKKLLDYLQVDYTMLTKEYCCGWVPLAQPAVMAKNEDDLAQAKELAEEFVVGNFKQAEALGARSIVLFCSACEPAYSNCQDATSLEIISFSELVDRYLEKGKLKAEIDYYAGCYRFRRKMTTESLDVEPAVRVLRKIEGLKVNYLDNSICCYIPPHLEQLTASLTTKSVVTICTGCYEKLKETLTDGYEVKMLPELVLAAVEGQ
ncbi:MAG: (Fe-S)-binding protein [Chloroflexi bacterium]|nr:(Fe-S)-binding protein [Chloroflexota bacterium]